MCYFITVSVDREYESTLKQKLRSSFTLLPNGNLSVVSQLKPQDISFLITDGMCACDLFAKPHFIKNNETKLRQKYSKPKYKKLGWTEAKIERVISDRLSQPAKDFSGLRADLCWILGDLVSITKRAIILVHFYSGDVQNEGISIVEKKAITCKDLQNNGNIIEEDVLIEIVL